MKRRDIIICPHFRFKILNNTVIKSFTVDCYCKLDNMLFYTECIENFEPTVEEIIKIKKGFINVCSTDCPKIWYEISNENHNLIKENKEFSIYDYDFPTDIF